MAVKFATNVPLTLCFPFGDFMPVQGQFGEQFLYTIEVDGQRDKLYATPLLHQHLQDAGIGAGEILTITKVEDAGNRKSWVLQPNDGNGVAPDSASDVSEQSPTSSPTAAQAANGREPPSRPDFESLSLLMANCLRASWRAWQGLDDETGCSSTDVRKVGISLFMECARKGVLPLPEAVDEGVPF